jgi:DNA-binding GntR family transcriptional regulator
VSSASRAWAGPPPRPSRNIYRAIRDGQPGAAAEATLIHLDNTLKDYRREIQRRVFGENLS